MVRVLYRGVGDKVCEDLYPDATTIIESKHAGFFAVQTDEQADEAEDGGEEYCLALYAKATVARVRLA